MKTIDFLLASFLGGAIGMSGSYVIYKNFLEKPGEGQNQQALDSKIRLVDFNLLALTQPKYASKEQLDSYSKSIIKNMETLSEEGYILIDSTMVISAPEELKLDPNILLSSTEDVGTQSELSKDSNEVEDTDLSNDF